jgi:hypothetical protein
VGNFAEHARAEGTVAHGVNDIADRFTFAEIQRFELFEFQRFHRIFHKKRFWFVIR